MMGRATRRLGLIAVLLLCASYISALPIQPNLGEMLKQAKKPHENYPPARAGWNGPEEKSAIGTPNPVYDQLRYAASPAAARAQFVQAAKPDWRALLVVTLVIVCWRSKITSARRSEVLTMPGGECSEQPDHATSPHSRAA